MLHRHFTFVLRSVFVFSLCLLALPGCWPWLCPCLYTTPTLTSTPTPTPTPTLSSAPTPTPTLIPTTTLLPTNQAPVVTDQSAGTPKNTATDITLSGTDADNDPLTFSIVADPSHGALMKKSDTVYTYTPATDYVGSDTFTYKANDGKADSNTAAVTITVNDITPTNQAPVVTDQAISTTMGTAKDITLAGTDADNDPLTFTIVTSPAQGTLVKKSDTVWTYTPTGNYIGSDSFTFKAGDGKADSNTAAVNITIIRDTLTIDCGSGVQMTLVKIPAGSFQMGTNSTDDAWFSQSRPVHTVTIGQAFYMGQYEVTQAQYQAVMGTNPSHFKDPQKPVEGVSWDNAVAFCQALATKSGYNIRLPSEAEWEYACKADKGNVDTKYYFGDDESQLGTYAWYFSNSGSTTHVVGTKTGNSFGLFDMSGNVWEWCQDWWHDTYSGAPTDGSAWVSPSGSLRVLRGGSWSDDDYYCRSSYRYRCTPTLTGSNGGFRVVSGN